MVSIRTDVNLFGWHQWMFAYLSDIVYLGDINARHSNIKNIDQLVKNL